MNRRWTVTSLVAALALTSVVWAGDPKTADEVLAFSATKAAATKSWTSEFKQSMNMLGGEMKFSGTLAFKQPRRLRMEMDMPMMGQQGKMLMIIGDDLWMWQQMEFGPQRQIIKMNMATVMSNTLAQSGSKLDPMQAMDPSRQWELTKEYLNYTLQPDGTADGQPAWVIEGTWKETAISNKQVAAQAAMFGKTRLHVSKKDGFVRQVEQFDKAGKNTVMTMQFTNVKLDADLPDARFKFVPPEGLPVMDMTEMAIKMGATGMGLGGGAPPPSQ